MSASEENSNKPTIRTKPKNPTTMPTTIPVFVLLGLPPLSDSHLRLELKPQFKWLPVKLYLGTSNKRSGIWPVRPFESSCLLIKLGRLERDWGIVPVRLF
nr:hypothetical protein Iba_chr11fCG3490 [Ipomoea batatas]